MKRIFNLLGGVVVCALLCGCGEEPADQTDGGANKLDGATSADGGPQSSCNVELLCPSSPPSIGGPGSYATKTLTVQWKYCEESQSSYADPVYVSLPDNLTGLTVVAEHGSTNTGFRQVKLGSRVLIDPESFGKPPFAHDPFDRQHEAAVGSTPVSRK